MLEQQHLSEMLKDLCMFCLKETVTNYPTSENEQEVDFEEMLENELNMAVTSLINSMENEKESENDNESGSEIESLNENLAVDEIAGDSLFSLKDFNRIYPNLDLSKDNDKVLEEIRSSLVGIPYYVEYTGDYIQAIKDLIAKYPNFKEYEDIFIPNEDLLGLRTDKIINMPNILIVGEPSCGKSSFVNQLCEIYKYYFRTSLGSGGVNFALTGEDKGYSQSGCGDVLRSMFVRDCGQPVANPLFILDEIDKGEYGTGHDRDLSGAFSVLLEPNNAKHFSDHFFKVEVDASHINYIAIANDINKIPSHVLSRFPIKLHVRNYTKDEIENVVLQNQYEKWLKDNSYNPARMSREIPDVTKSLIYELSHGQPREVPAVLSSIAEKSICKNGKGEIYVNFFLNESKVKELKQMFEQNPSENRKRIGFTN